MLKTIPPTTNCSCGYFKTKCAEIHYQISSFSILCIFCGLTTMSYEDFLEHFQNMHFDDINKSLESTAEPIVTTICEDEDNNSAAQSARNRKASFRVDPLEFKDKDMAKNQDEVIKKLQQQEYEVKQLKTELQEHVEDNADMKTTTKENGFIDKQLKSKAATNESLNNSEENDTDDDDNFQICKIKVETCELQANKALKELSYLNSEGHVKEELETNMFVEFQSIFHENNSERDNDDNCSQIQLNDDASESTEILRVDAAEDFDWSKPYEPNLLKNHEKRPYKPRNKPNICSYCGRTFRRRYQLDTHLNIHTGLKPHQCDVCGRQFRAVTTLTRHLNTHEHREVHTCKYCEKGFTHKAALLSHELRHTQERRVPCDECAKCFYTSNQMDTHKRRVHHKIDDDGSLRYACELCTKRYRSASMLSTHKFKKHYKTAKFACEQCDKKFINEQQLEKHKVIHIDGSIEKTEENR